MAGRRRATLTPGDSLALVPARGGSRSIARKNVRPLGGRPLLEWVLAAIAESGAAARTCVTTDDDEIAQVAAAAGAEVPFRRPAELAGDDSPTIAAVEHALAWYADAGVEPEYVLLVQPTEPFVRPGQIRAAFELMVAHDADSAITVVEAPRTYHPFHVRVRDEEGFVRIEREDDHYRHPTRQSDPPRWAFGNLYWVRRAAFLRERRLETSRCVGLPVDAISAFDLNTAEDWRIAEALIASGAHDADDPSR
jgi:CMP-N-acetylneuraminic acid synthetase